MPGQSEQRQEHGHDDAIQRAQQQNPDDSDNGPTELHHPGAQNRPEVFHMNHPGARHRNDCRQGCLRHQVDQWRQHNTATTMTAVTSPLIWVRAPAWRLTAVWEVPPPEGMLWKQL